MIFSPGPLLSQPPGSCFPDPNSHNWCKAIQEAKIAAKKDAAYLETRDKAAADYLPKSHSWCKTIQKAKIASKKDAAYLEARDNAAADYETSALPYRPIPTSLALQQSQTRHKPRNKLSHFPDYDAGEDDVCVVTEPSTTPEMPKLAVNGYDAWSPRDTLNGPSRFTSNLWNPHMRQNSLLKSVKRKRTEDPDIIYPSAKSQRRAEPDWNSTRQQSRVSSETDSNFDPSVWDVQDHTQDHTQLHRNFYVTGHFATKSMDASRQPYELRRKRHETPLGSVNEFQVVEDIINVHSKYDENPRRNVSNQYDGRFHNSRPNGLAKGIVTGSSRTTKSSQPARPVSTHSAGDVMEIDCPQIRGGYDTATTSRSGKDTREQYVQPQDVDDISEVDEHKEPLRQSRTRLGISAAQQIRDVVTLSLQHKEKLTRPSRKMEERRSPRLSEKFIRDNTEQRNTHAAKIRQDVLDDDIDELSYGSPFFPQPCGMQVKFKPERTRYCESDGPRIEIGTELSDDSGSDELHSCDIRSTKFIHSRGASQQSKLANANEREPRAREPRQRFRLCFFSCHLTNISDPEELTVESDKASGCFPVWCGGTQVFTIQPKLVQRMDLGRSTGEGGKHIRLLGSKHEIGGQYVVHMGFANAEEFQKFVMEIEEVTKGVLNPRWRSAVEMSKIYKEWLKNRDQARSGPESVHATDELALLEQRAKNRQQPRVYQAEIHKSVPAKVVSQLKPDNGTRKSAMSHGQMASEVQNGIIYDPPRDEEYLMAERLEHDVRSSGRISARQTTRAPKRVPTPPMPLKRYSEVQGLGSPWDQPVVYPPGGSNKTTVNFEDLSRLDDGEFLNDSLVSFCLRYFQSLNPETENNVHLFNTYFYASLTKQAKTKKGINYDLVKRWTSKLDLFGKDYVIVPINENIHWYVAIICNLRNIELGFHNENPETFTDTSRITTIDTALANNIGRTPSPDLLSGSPQEVQNKPTRQEAFNEVAGDMLLVGQTLKMSLSEDDGHDIEVREAHNIQPTTELVADKDDDMEMNAKGHESAKATESLQDTPACKTPKKKTSRKSLGGRKYDLGQPIIITLDSFGLSHSAAVRNLKDYISEEGKSKRQMEATISAGLTAKGIPLQENYCDCGLYVVGYVKKFLEDPATFVKKILQKEMDEKTDWPGFSASNMRAEIRDILQDEYEMQKRKRAGPDKDNVSRREAKGPTAGYKARQIQQPASEEPIQKQCDANRNRKFNSKWPAPEDSSIPVGGGSRKTTPFSDAGLSDGRDASEFRDTDNDMLDKPGDTVECARPDEDVECVRHTESPDAWSQHQSWLDQLTSSASLA